jgi:glutathione S-transferase
MSKKLTVFFDWSSPPSRSLIMFCKYARIPNVHYKEVRLTKNEHHTPEFTAINPNQQVPAILEEDTVTGTKFGMGES